MKYSDQQFLERTERMFDITKLWYKWPVPSEMTDDSWHEGENADLRIIDTRLIDKGLGWTMFCMDLEWIGGALSGTTSEYTVFVEPDNLQPFHKKNLKDLTKLVVDCTDAVEDPDAYFGEYYTPEFFEALGKLFEGNDLMGYSVKAWISWSVSRDKADATKLKGPYQNFRFSKGELPRIEIPF